MVFVRRAHAAATLLGTGARTAVSASLTGRLRDPSLVATGSLIDGQWVHARSGARFLVDDPATGETLASVPDMNTDALSDAIHAAHAAFAPWSKRPAKVCILFALFCTSISLFLIGKRNARHCFGHGSSWSNSTSSILRRC